MTVPERGASRTSGAHPTRDLRRLNLPVRRWDGRDASDQPAQSKDGQGVALLWPAGGGIADAGSAFGSQRVTDLLEGRPVGPHGTRRPQPDALEAGGRGKIGQKIGHGTRTTDELASLLVTAGVETLIEVRRYPTGRRQPHLARERLAADLPEEGIGYEWWGRRSAAVGWWRERRRPTRADVSLSRPLDPIGLATLHSGPVPVRCVRVMLRSPSHGRFGHVR